MERATTWPPAGSPLAGQRGSALTARIGAPLSLERRAQLALALLGAGPRALAVVTRRVLHSAGWLLAAAVRPPQQQKLFGAFKLRRWHLLLGAVVTYKLLRAGSAALWTHWGGWSQRKERKRLCDAMRFATTYSEWLKAAMALDELSGNSCRRPSTRQVRSQQKLEQRAAMLARLRESDDITGLTSALRLDYLRQAGNASTSALLEATGHCPVLPPAVQQYIDEVKRCLHHVISCSEMALEDRLAFLRELRHAYGRTGLVLSGGGSFGFWHFGVVKALLDAKLLPRVVSGSSAGSIGGALLCTRTDEEVHTLVANFPETAGLDFFSNTSTAGQMRHLLSSGYIQNHEFFVGRLRKLLGDLTFLDAYQRSGRILSVAVTAADTKEPSRILNYLTAPNVLIWSAVACSSAFPFLFAPQDLLCKDTSGHIVRFSETGAAQSQRRWCDGSLEEDLPMRGLSEMFNVNFFIASQANPYLIGVVSLKNLLPTTLGRLMESEFKHRCQQLLAVWPDSRLLKMLCQPWEGDITVSLPPTAFSISKAALNFSPDDIWVAMRHAQQAVWAKVPAIQAACAIEVCIDELLQQVTLQVRRQAKLEQAVAQRRMRERGLRASLPSWLHMPSIGLPTVGSENSLAEGGMTPSHSTASLGAPAEATRNGVTAGRGSPVSPGPLDASSPRALPWQPNSPRASSREGGNQRFGSGSLNVAVGIPLAAARGPASAEVAAAAGFQATTAQLAVAGLEVAAEALSDIEPGTPAARYSEEEAATTETEEGHPLFESPSQAWRDLLVLGGISAAAGGQGGSSLDAFAY